MDLSRAAALNDVRNDHLIFDYLIYNFIGDRKICGKVPLCCYRGRGEVKI